MWIRDIRTAVPSCREVIRFPLASVDDQDHRNEPQTVPEVFRLAHTTWFSILHLLRTVRSGRCRISRESAGSMGETKNLVQ